MRGIRRWVTTAVVLAGPFAAVAQTPIGKPSSSAEPPIAVALPGGTVVGSSRGPVTQGPVLTATAEPAPEPRAPAAAEPIAEPAPAPHVVPGPGGSKDLPVLPSATPVAGYLGQCTDCCGPIGAHGPIGQEVYVRGGINSPTGDGLLAHNIKQGWSGQIGVRAQFFEPAGDSAWAIDAHVIYSRNQGRELDIVTFRTEPVAVHMLHRTAVGLGVGRDWFLNRPGFLLDTWDANFRFGFDVGGRWGAGHVDFSTPFEPGGYRRHYDVFGQAFIGLMATVEVPIGGYQVLFGARVEGARTFNDLLEKDSNFDDITTMLMFGVRY
jgi:hypothetical protein